MRTKKLGTAEFEAPIRGKSQENVASMVGRGLYIASMAALVPESVEAFVEIFVTHYEKYGPVKAGDIDSMKQQAKLLEPVGNVWRERFGLMDDWWFEGILTAIVLVVSKLAPTSGFKSATDELRRLVRQLKAQKEARLPPQRLVIDLGEYLPSRTYRKDFIEQARRLCNEQIERYCDERERLAAESGWKKTPRKRRLDPYLWLAGFHVLRWPARLIADAEKKESRRTVEEQIMQVASEIGLSIRGVREYDDTQAVETARNSLAIARERLEDILPDEIPTEAIEIAPPLILHLMSARSPGEQEK